MFLLQSVTRENSCFNLWSFLKSMFFFHGRLNNPTLNSWNRTTGSCSVDISFPYTIVLITSSIYQDFLSELTSKAFDSKIQSQDIETFGLIARARMMSARAFHDAGCYTQCISGPLLLRDPLQMMPGII